jgi:hypothetical protein
MRRWVLARGKQPGNSFCVSCMLWVCARWQLCVDSGLIDWRSCCFAFLHLYSLLLLSVDVVAAVLQERVQIQKYVCQACSQTWRSDD